MPSVQEMSTVAQRFTGLDLPTVLPSVTTYASLSETDNPTSYVLLDAAVTSQSQQPSHNIYWGYEGYPDSLTIAGRNCVANIIVFLSGTKTAIPGAPARTRP
jgi:hypothetical protein